MTNSDFLIKATMKKLSEKINKTFFKKIEDAANVAQEVPDILKQELESLKNEILLEARRMEKEESEYEGTANKANSSTDPKIERNIEQINIIKNQLEQLNQLLDK